MKRIILRSVLIITLALLVSACNKNNITNPPVPNDTGYFPNGDGSTYTYSVETSDSSGTLTAGTRNTEYSGTEVKDGSTYQVQIDSFNVSGLSSISLSFFRKTNDAVFYYLDTTGLSAVVPDTLRNYLSIDKESKFISFPVTVNQSWPVFRLSLVYSLINVSVLTLNGSYDGTESVTLHLTSGDITENTVKLKYSLNLTIPGTPSTSTFTAYVWLADGIGVVKWQGNAVILNAFTGGSITLSDTTTVVTQSLTSYNVKQ